MAPMTMGIVVVACFAASTASVPPVTMTSTWRPTGWLGPCVAHVAHEMMHQWRTKRDLSTCISLHQRASVQAAALPRWVAHVLHELMHQWRTKRDHRLPVTCHASPAT